MPNTQFVLKCTMFTWTRPRVCKYLNWIVIESNEEKFSKKLKSSSENKSANARFYKTKTQKQCHSTEIYNKKKHGIHLADIVNNVLKCNFEYLHSSQKYNHSNAWRRKCGVIFTTKMPNLRLEYMFEMVVRCTYMCDKQFKNFFFRVCKCWNAHIWIMLYLHHANTIAPTCFMKWLLNG